MQGLWAREGLTQAQFAERLNIRQHHVSEMENGRRSIGTEMAHCLGELFDILYRVFL
ncbi:helix-turn-helix transcriptional regulator [Bilophila wadsworthia]|uniref:helix-turn-helix transcriptional regulator n=1 Tax=Bilophila wadsworthia TaxID=35833 RepID=UPI0027B8A10B|nr:helix-turn-helix transcriptional regulator [Bilophila wadsworthia]MDU4377506.1 helix-turn-helix transcriptional regulator [Bilophila wadsworthia]